MMSNEEIFIQRFCDSLGRGYCEQAKEQVEKSRNCHIPAQILTSLTHLTQYERAYISLYFLEQKWFPRRDPLKNAFLNLQNEFKTVADQERKNKNKSIAVFADVCDDLSVYCTARSDCIDLYEQMLKSPTSWNLKDLEQMAKEILQKYKNKMNLKYISSLKTGFTNELNILQTLLHTSCEISEWTFFSSLMNLYQVCQLLEENAHLLKKETVKSGFFSFREKPVTPTSAIHQWLHRFHLTLMSKFSLYFYKALSDQTENLEELRSLCVKNNIDYVSKCNSLCKRNDHIYVTFVLDCKKLNEMPQHGYTLPQSKTEQRKENYMKIIEFPTKVQQSHYNILEVNFEDVKSSDKILSVYEKQTASNYYVSCIENRIYMAIIVEGKKAEKDSQINSFIHEISSSLKPKKIFTFLRPGNK